MRIFTRLALIAGIGLSTPAIGQVTVQLDFAGPYLAARHAALQGDHRVAAEYFLEVLSGDPENHVLRGDAMLALAAVGDWNRASALAAELPAEMEGREFADLILQIARIRDGNLAGASEAIAEQRGAGPLVDPMLAGWLFLGEGDMSRATETFVSIIESNSPIAGLVPYQLALARASVGDFEGADRIFSGEEYGPLQVSSRGLRAHAQVLVQLDRHEDALELLDTALERNGDQSLVVLRASIAENPTRPYDFITTPQEGMAEVLFNLSRALGTEAGTTLPLIYARAAHVIDPEHVHSLLLAADILAETGQYVLAEETYAQVPRENPLFVDAELGRSEALFQMDRTDAAVEVLSALVRDYPAIASVHTALGDVLRRLERYAGAVTAYSDALDLVDRSRERTWFLYYARGISYDNLEQWEEAEADFRAALELSPGQPNVLNYLGYSLVEQRRNLDEALDMIERAVTARPTSGYIVDSLGWVFYRLGRYEEAVDPMERAVELLPNDSIVNDHLGDVYWMVGREREARFQWSRALSFGPEPAEAARIRRKLDVGLDAVLAEEEESGGQ
ncbi:tetratricopeptide repeat protein [Rhodophyticola sp. DY48A3-103]|nr:tetratricopeptide repeat protein [Alterinioella nitratireducens]NPD20059.1 tetratricopeptide repeat protein [Alterinioella nitratireducens]